MLVRTPSVTYEKLREGFRWHLPAIFNIGVAGADVHPPSAPALIELQPDGSRRDYSFGELVELSNRLANGLRARGVRAGDRVGIVLPQRVETGLSHLAIYKLGAIAVPMSVLLGPDALRHRLDDCTPRMIIAGADQLERLAEVGATELVTVDGVRPPHRRFWELVEAGSARLTPAATTPETPALLVYTSGTTGAPKGALHAHGVLLGHLPGFELSHDFFPQTRDLFWTPADWAWIGGLMDALMPSWYHGKPVVAAARERFDPEWAERLIADIGVRNAFLPPTALKLMRQAGVTGAGTNLRTVMCGGEVLGEEVLDWTRQALGVTINEIYGQTEANYLVGNSSEVWEVRPGSMGRPYPGHDVAVLRPDGAAAAPGERGEIAVRAPDPVLFREYWRRPDATREKYDGSGEWLLTGDLATADEQGYLWYAARTDDVINSAGYRIGPDEVEQCLMGHPAVAMAAAVGAPEPVRGEVVKAFVVLTDGHEPSTALEHEIGQLVRGRLAAYAYPREIEFVEQLPLTVTGKIRRAELRRRERERRTEGQASARASWEEETAMGEEEGTVT